MSRELRLDEIGNWTEIKLAIVQDYATAYSVIMRKPRTPWMYHIYIDAFAGTGIHLRRATGEFVLGSPLNALNIEPPFREYHFIDLDQEKVEALRELVGARPDVTVHEGDANELLVTRIFPSIRWESYKRGLCLLDPYGLHLRWEVIAAAGASRTVEIFLNFPIVDMNRNVLWRNPDLVKPDQAARLTAYWGDDSWRDVAYTTEGSLFGYETKRHNDMIAAAFRDRLRQVAGFEHVPEPLALVNSRGATLYYLFFAAHKPVAAEIVDDIFNRHRVV